MKTTNRHPAKIDPKARVGRLPMKRLVFLTAVIFISIPAVSLEFGADFRMGNLAFQHDRSSGDLTFPGTALDWGIALFGSQKVSDTLNVKMGFYMDPILRNIAYTTISYTEGIMVVEVGPFFGFLNSEWSPILKPGISASAKVDFPGILFLGLGADCTLNTHIRNTLDYFQEKTSFFGGFYVENAICTLSLSKLNFTQIHKDGYEMNDSLLDISFLADLYQKNTPYKLNMGFAYQVLTKAFYLSGGTVKHTLGSILVSSALEINITEAVFLVIGAEASLYTYGFDDLLALSMPPFLMNGHAGIRVNIDRFLELGRIE